MGRYSLTSSDRIMSNGHMTKNDNIDLQQSQIQTMFITELEKRTPKFTEEA